MNLMTTQNIKYMVRWKRSVKLIWISDIEYVKADGNFSIIHLTNGDYSRNEKSLKEVFENLYSFNFLKIHKSYIINVNLCKELDLTKNRRAIMESKIHVPVSRNKAREIMTLCKNGVI